MPPTLRPLALLLLLAFPSSALAQQRGTIVTPSATGHYLVADGAPLIPLGGWMGLGTAAESPYQHNRASIRADLDRIAASGATVVFVGPSAGGRIVARQPEPGAYNWINYQPSGGHPRLAPYVEAMRWLQEEAARRGIYTLVSVQSFIRPLLSASSSYPDGTAVLSCETFAELVRRERATLVASVQRYELPDTDPEHAPPVDCAAAPGAMPSWEWHIWYIVRSLRDAPALAGWFLFDEPVNPARADVFGTYPANMQGGGEAATPRPWPATSSATQTGGIPEAIRTPDLLRHVYEHIVASETAGEGPSYRRHPVFLDEATWKGLVSQRFPWNRAAPPFSDGQGGSTSPLYFDRVVGKPGVRRLPADVLIHEASIAYVHMEASPDGAIEARPWWQELGAFIRSGTAPMMDIVREDSLWAGWQLTQAQLPGGVFDESARHGYRVAEAGRTAPGFGALYGPLRDSLVFEDVTRLLNDRDLVMQSLAPLAEGATGLHAYALAYTPRAGRYAAYADRHMRLTRQLRDLGLDRVLATPALEEGVGWQVDELTVLALTDYARRDPVFLGTPEANRFDAGRSVYDAEAACPCPASETPYTWRHYGRASGEPGERGTGQARKERGDWRGHADFRHLRARVHRRGSSTYLLLANIYDARIRTTIRLESLPGGLAWRAAFDLDAADAFRWRYARDAARPDGDATRLTVELEPYEARLYLLRPTR